ncbi:TIGR00730 family Rossman fold protein [Anaeromyxobacter diazotrophicus]|uniref:Cytokinin riboside 5'-monophosphate phosphoribohydrolase n=1 Tax=Anaeromyxobacter diazotrophicus TaxID=2590199 RepID=A0A7I9VIU8_9BACT|nr:TIGR00730 family Rossman fold protein [Anaeromyxobacter diazotrophicus]GEJ56295.1 putative cytokinin riboside 5'-monophosphate phosphoribohydrolase [Anaeromyxobacter diazotrophicus]
MKRICVFCGSSPGARPAYLATARALGRELASRGLGLVYGGSSVGLMGAVADGALAAGGEVVGIIPGALEAKELAHHGLTRLEVVASMHERKARMAELADGFVALPGGMGTLEELSEILTWAQLGLHRKACALLDVAGYWQPLIAFFDHAVKERFLRPEHRALLLVGAEPGPLLDALARHAPAYLEKWIDRGQT